MRPVVLYYHVLVPCARPQFFVIQCGYQYYGMVGEEVGEDAKIFKYNYHTSLTFPQIPNTFHSTSTRTPTPLFE
jgi:hypothetical protein